VTRILGLEYEVIAPEVEASPEFSVSYICCFVLFVACALIRVTSAKSASGFRPCLPENSDHSHHPACIASFSPV
jgi:hypothetical protein